MQIHTIRGGTVTYSCSDRAIAVCVECAKAIDGLVVSSKKTREKALLYLEEKRYEGFVSDEGLSLIHQRLLKCFSEGGISKKDLDGWGITDEEAEKALRGIMDEEVEEIEEVKEIEEAEETVEVKETEKAQNEKSEGLCDVMIGCGLSFLLLAVVLFVISLRKMPGSSLIIANIQTTVFSAASAVAGVICLVGATVVSKVQMILNSFVDRER